MCVCLLPLNSVTAKRFDMNLEYTTQATFYSDITRTEPRAEASRA